jgi:hypothetical protein
LLVTVVVLVFPWQLPPVVEELSVSSVPETGALIFTGLVQAGAVTVTLPTDAVRPATDAAATDGELLPSKEMLSKARLRNAIKPNINGRGDFFNLNSPLNWAHAVSAAQH